jgi:fluoride exporter
MTPVRAKPGGISLCSETPSGTAATGFFVSLDGVCMKLTLFQYLAVAAGGSLGAMLRFAVARIFTWSAFPVGTFLINVSGSLFLGWFLTVVNDRVISVNDYTRLGIATGFVGAYTTFSTYMFESDKMLQDSLGLRAIFYLLGSLMAGLIAVRYGVILARRPWAVPT